jgi:hypothetical protein
VIEDQGRAFLTDQRFVSGPVRAGGGRGNFVVPLDKPPGGP